MRQHVPNLITSLRLIAAPILVYLIVEAHDRAALLLIALAGITDWLDGWSARKLSASGKTGVVFDPAADKVMLVTLFCSLAAVSLIPMWYFALAIGRDLVIVIGSLLLVRFRNIRRFAPLTVGKVSTFFQIVYGLLALCHGAFPLRFVLWLDITALILSTIFTAASGIGYVRKGIRLAAMPAQQA